MASLEELKAKVDIHDLAEKLGVRRQGNIAGGKGLYHSPNRDDKKASLSVFADGHRWKDFATDEGGTAIDFVMYVEGIADVGEAIRRVHELSGIPMDRPAAQEAPRERSRVEFIADRCLDQASRCKDYLVERAIGEGVIQHAILRKSLGYNDWASDKVAAGEPMHGGPAVAFIVRSLNPGHVSAVDMRYLDPALNGGIKTSCQGEKSGVFWTSDARRLAHASTVYVVESPINALSIETAFDADERAGHVAAVATRGVSALEAIDWRFARGKRVLVCMDHRDKLNAEGERPGLKAAWRLTELLVSIDVAALLVDQSGWEEGSDVNDFLKSEGAAELKIALGKLEPWLLPGMPADDTPGKRRIYLPWHDFTHYGRYRVRDDFTAFIDRYTTKEGEAGEEKVPQFSDLAGFRVASLSRVSIASEVAMMTGEKDLAPEVLFAVSVQTPRHGARLVRRVFQDEELHNVEKWKKLGPVFNQAAFLRMVNILERSAHLGARHAVNFVGLAWKDGELRVNEGTDCYFTDPEKQCPYHNLTFPSGTLQDGRAVIAAYQATFQRNAAAMLLAWALGAHLKTYLGRWPHFVLQADKGAGKSTLVKRLERSIGMTMFSGQSLQTEFRLLTSISNTTHPVGWEEISARRQDIIDKAVAMLQESYQYTPTRRGAEMTRYLLSAPVLLAGEDVPVRSLTGKLVRTELTGKKGPIMPEDLPRFPVRQWLTHLAGLKRAQVGAMAERMQAYCLEQCRATGADEGARRMVENYALVATAWRLLCDWLELDPKQGDFPRDLLAEMNAHIEETSGDRQPWVWIVETLLSEIAAGEFRFPFAWDEVEGRDCLLVRTAHVMDHLARTMQLREKWNASPVKSDRVFKRQLGQARAALLGPDGQVRDFERTLGEVHGLVDNRRRVAHMVALDLDRLAEFGVYAVRPGSTGDLYGRSPAPPNE